MKTLGINVNVKKIFNYIFLCFLFPSIIYPQTWWHTIRTPGHTYQRGWDICRLTDGNFIIAGQEETGTFEKINLIKISKFGNVIWSKFYSDSSSSYIKAYACESTNDNGCIVSGLRNDWKPFAIKFDSNGNIIWNKTYEGHNIYERTIQIERCTDNGYILCGLDHLLKIDSAGQFVWAKTNEQLGIIGPIYSVAEAFDNSYICLGQDSYTNYPVISKTSQNGVVQWQKTYTDMFSFCSIIRKLSNCYIIMGYVPDSVPYPYTNYYYFFAKIDTAGNVISRHQGFDSTGRTEHFLRGLDVLDDNRFIFTSDDYFDFFVDSIALTVFKIVDSTGKIIHKNIIRKENDGGYDPYNILPLNDGHIMYVGTAYLSSSSLDLAVFVARTDTTLYIDPVGISNQSNSLPDNFKLYQNYPNPFNPKTKINYSIPKDGFVSIKVFDMLGREAATLVSDYKKAGNYITEFNASGLSSGVYYCKMISGDFSDVKKMFLIK